MGGQGSAAQGQGEGRRNRRHRHHQPARDGGDLGQGDRQADPQGDRLAGQAHRAALREAEEAGLEKKFSRKTGLLLDPYFSGTKIAWLLDNVKGARKRAEKGELLAGTIDTFLVWRLTGGKVHATDATNASRTLVYNIEKNEWDAELLKILNIPSALLPKVKDCADDFGVTEQDDPRRCDPDPRRRRRPACGDDRPGLLQARHDEIDLRHRLLRGAQHRRGHRALEEPAAHHHRLSPRRQDHLCARRLDLHRRRRRPVAARRRQDDLQGGAQRRTRGTSRRHPERLSRAGLCRTGRAALGRRRARRDLRPHPQFRSGRVRARGPRGRRLSRRATCSTR